MALVGFEGDASCVNVEVVNAFRYSVLGSPGDHEHMLASRMMLGEECAGAVIDGAELLFLPGRDDNRVRLIGGRGERIDFVLDKPGLANRKVFGSFVRELNLRGSR